ncbi:MAG: N-acetyl-gamma-glutamyl-phosphate reductase [Candidatus Kapabacteria bacterium]|nr:N-acetyl-gamma-glutamyl-phosphate reductase [Candidatus Kapabacteria bacterium]
MIRVAVIGAAGYTGGEVIRLLLHHPEVGHRNILSVSTSHAGRPVSSVHQDLVGEFDTSFVNDETLSDVDVVFLCQGHGKSREWIVRAELHESVIVIDLSADHRLAASWCYGLPEKTRDAIRTSKRIANPGCFATCIELGLLPLAENGRIVGDVHTQATTGSTGAGQAPSETTHFSWRSSNLGVYKAFTHQHLDEISMTLGIKPVLIPLRGSFTRGILSASVLRTELDASDVHALFVRRYADQPFTHIVDDLPDVKRVVNTNKCLIGIEKHGDHLLIVSVIDNLLKGASGQAVQNMNIACGFDERSGLDLKSSVY